MKLRKLKKGDPCWIKNFHGVERGAIVKYGLFFSRVMTNRFRGPDIEWVPNWNVLTEEEGQRFIDVALRKT